MAKKVKRHETKRVAKKIASHINKEYIVDKGKNTRFGMNGKTGGRKPLVMELKAKELILSKIGGQKGFDEIIAKIFQQAKKGSFRHQELLLNYILGKPTDRVMIESTQSSVPVGAPIIKIIADTLRLERLNKDVEDMERATPEDRIKEAEDLLNKEIDKEE